MMEIQRLVTGAKLGDNDAFGALVKLYQRRLLASMTVMLGDYALAEDVVQEAFIRAWSRLSTLRTTEAFPGWLWSIARNLARSQCRGRDAAQCADQDEDWPDPRSLEPEAPTGAGWERLLGLLTPDQRLLVGLRYGAGLSLRQIAVVLGIPDQRVKSRLFTLRRKLDRAWGREFPEDPPPLLEEKIMTKIETLRLGAHAFERLSLAVQAQFARAVLVSTELPEAVLAELGKIDRGPEFLALYGTRLELGELIGILNHVDRFTECRLVEHLEVVAPEEAERIKQNMFVFEDLVMFDAKALALLAASADLDVLAEALAGTGATIRQQILDGFTDEVRADLVNRFPQVDGDRRRVRAAQELIVFGIKDLEQTGRLALRRKGDLADGELYLTAT